MSGCYRPRMVRVARVLLVIAILSLVGASPVAADGCYGWATISPASGAPGTTFVFRTGLGMAGDDTTLRIYRNGQRVKTVVLTANSIQRYAIKTTAADAGRWSAIASNNPECHTPWMHFTVGLPETATAARTIDSAFSLAILALAALVGGWAGLALGGRGKKRTIEG